MKLSNPILTLLLLVLFSIVNVQAHKKIVYQFQIHEEIGPAMTRLTQIAIAEAEKLNAAYLLIDMDTYGGLVADGDNIRTALLKTKIPTMVLVRNNAASAGALIAIACDSIYMMPGSTIGAASVVNQEGELMPEKYQSYMRKKMRATAEETGRSPLIAEGMTDENLVIDSIKEKGKIVTFSVKEAIKYGYCNREVNSAEDIVKLLNDSDYEIKDHVSGAIEKALLWLVNPAVSGIFLLFIFAGIYFEFKAPGTLLPIALSIVAALFYFAPLYLEGLAANWEILVFAVGIILLLLEIFVIPGFGVAGIAGTCGIITGLTLALIRNINFDFSFVPSGSVAVSFFMVTVAMALPLVVLLIFGQQIFNSSIFKKMGVEAEMTTAQGFSIKDSALENLIGASGVTATHLRPSGKVEIDNELYDAITDGSFISKDTNVKVIEVRSTYLVVKNL